MINTTGAQVELDGQTYTFAVDQDGWPMEACTRCGGTGNYSFNGHDGRCYLCSHAGRPSWTRYETGQDTPADAQRAYAQVLRTRRLARDRRDRQREAKAAVAREAIAAERAALAPRFDAFPGSADATYYDNFVAAGVPDRVIRGYAFACGRYEDRRGLTDRVLAIAAEVTGRIVAQANAAGTVEPLAAGRQAIAGTVASVRWYDGDYGSVRKITIVLSDGHRLFGTCPRSVDLDDDALTGATITLTAAVEPSPDDPTFARFTRPTKATVAV